MFCKGNLDAHVHSSTSKLYIKSKAVGNLLTFEKLTLHHFMQEVLRC